MKNNNKITCRCHECDLAVTLPELALQQKALCPRCGYVLTLVRKNANERILALSITSIVFMLASLPFEFLSFQASGLENKFNLLQSFTILFANNYPILAAIEIVTIFIIPIIILSGLFYVLFPLRFNAPPRHGKKVLDVIFMLLPWAMVEIFLVGVLVSLVKIMSMADIGIGPSFVAFILFTVAMTSVLLHLDKVQLYQQLEQASLKGNSQLATTTVIERDTRDTKKSSMLSIQKTWALIITATVFYIPANLLPIMNTRLLGQDEPSTIFGGVVLLWRLGSYPISAIIFIASVAVPIAKILILAWLNYSVQRNHTDKTMERLKLYRIAEFVGRWSMVDIFVVIILASLIQLGNTMSIYPGPATLAFSGSVIVTMLAAMSFEPKLIWQVPDVQK